MLGFHLELCWPIRDLLDPKTRFCIARQRSVEVTRALELIWDPIFDHFREKCEGFPNFVNFTFKKSTSQGFDFLCNNFLCVV